MYTTSYSNLYSSFLYHSGVKGMKWGIRRKVAKNKAKAGVLSKQSEEYIHARDARMKNLGGRALAFAGGYWKSDQGRYYQHRAKGRSVVNAAARVHVRRALIGAAAIAVMSIGYNKVMDNI